MTIRELTEEILTTQTLKDIASAYTEISSMRLKKIRKQTELSRTFFQDLTNIFALLQHLAKTKNLNRLIQAKGKTIVILITSNFRFYGKVTNAAARLFMKFTRDNPCDQIVVGKLGAEFLKSQHYGQSFRVLNFKKDIPDNQEMAQLIQLVKNYGRVIVVYSEFKTILTQEPRLRDLSQIQTQTAGQSLDKKPQFTFILEPEIEKMMDFFDSQIKKVLLYATFLETELARVASRLIAMDKAQENANELLGTQKQQLIFAKRDLFNKKTMETWAAIRGQLNPRSQIWLMK